MMRFALLTCLMCSLLLVGCGEEKSMQTFVNSEDEKRAKGYIALLRQGKFEQIEKDLDPSLSGPNVRSTFTKMLSLIPESQEPKSVKVVGFNVSKSLESSMTNVTFEYEFPGKWLLINVAKKMGQIPS